MTDYAAASDITENVKGLTVSATTAVTSDALADMISQESAVIDQHILPRYTLPITNATSLLFLKKICIDLVVYRVTKVLQPKTAPAAPDDKVMQDISHSSAYREAMKMLRNLMDGTMTLPGETAKTVNFFKSTAVDDDIETNFDADCRQW